MKKILSISSLFFLILLLAGGTKTAMASHMAGSDMEFKCLGKDTYQIVLRVYRDCKGVPINSSPQITFTPDAPCSGTRSVTMTRTLVRPVRFMCAGGKTICEVDTGFPFGMEENRFEVTVAFNSLWPGGLDPSCCWVNVSYEECCRNGALNSNINPGMFYINARINRCQTPCNSSPQITNYPVAVICAGQGYWFNNGILDTVDYDSISYELADPLQGYESPESFINGFSKEKPFNFLGFPNNGLPFPAGFNLNPTNGDLGFTAMSQQQPVLAFKITEWRKDASGVYQKIGETRRDVQFYTYQCPPNNPPELEVNGNRSGPWNFNVCAGQTLCLNIKATDKDTTINKMDTTRLSWNKGIPGATFTNVNTPNLIIRWDEGVFCWTPPSSYASTLPYYFTVRAEDNNCPVPGSTTKAIGIRVKPSPEGVIAHTPLGCSKFGFDVTVTNQHKLTQTPSFQWTIPNVGNGNFNGVNAATYNGKVVASHKFPVGGTFIIRLRMEADQCVNFIWDTVQVDSPVKAIAQQDTFVCISDPFTVGATAKNGLKPYKFKWITGNEADTFNTLALTNNITTKDYVIEVKDSFLCVSYDTFNLEIKQLPRVNAGPDQRICFDDSAMFDAGDNEGRGLVSYTWTTPDGTRSDQIIFGNDSGQYKVKVVDSFMCVQRDSALLYVNKEVLANAGKDDSLCIFNNVTLHASGGQTYKWRELGSAIPISQNPDLPLNPQQAGIKDYTITVSQTYGNLTCYDVDTVRVVTNPLPVITIPNKTVGFCISNNWLDPGTKSGAQPTEKGKSKYGWYGGWWSIADASKQNCFESDTNKSEFGWVKLNCLGVSQETSPGVYKPFKLTYNYINVNGCFSKDSISLVIYPLPPVEAGPAVSICQNATKIALNPGPNTGPPASKWISPSPDPNDPKSPLEYINMSKQHWFHPTRATEDTTYMLVYQSTIPYNNPNANCTNQDTTTIYVKPIPKVNAGRLADVCEDKGIVDLKSASGNYPNNPPTSGTGVWTGPGVEYTAGNYVFNTKATGGVPIVYGKFPPNVLEYCFTNDLSCTVCDTTTIVVNRLPATKLPVQPDVCESVGSITLKGNKPNQGTGTYYLNVNGTWNPTPGTFSAVPGPTTLVQYGLNRALYSFTDINGCKKDDSTTFSIQARPEVDIVKTPALCEGIPFLLHGTMKNTTAFMWTRVGDGNFKLSGGQLVTTTSDNDIEYVPGVNDIFNGSFKVTLTSTDNGLCDPEEKSSFIKINKNPSGDFTAIPEGCAPFIAEFDGDFDGAAYIEWTFGDGAVDKQNNEDPAHKYQKPGTYDVKVYLRSPDSCEATIVKPFFIKTFITPDALFSPDKKKSTVALPRFTFIDKTALNDELPENVFYSWDFGDPRTDEDTSSKTNPTYVYPSETGYYTITLNLRTIHGCVSEWIDSVRIEPDITVFAPNVFRPHSGEKNNKRFYIVIDGQRSFHLDVFNRWGELVFATDDPNEGWNGQYKWVDCQQDVYAWQVTVLNYSGTPYKYNGTVTLLR